MVVEVDELAVDHRRLCQTRRHETFSSIWLDAVVLMAARRRLTVELVRRRVTVLLNYITNTTLARRYLILQIELGDLVVAIVVANVLRLLLEQLLVTKNRLLRNASEVWRRVEVVERKVHDFLRLHPLVVHVVEALEMNNLR